MAGKRNDGQRGRNPTGRHTTPQQQHQQYIAKLSETLPTGLLELAQWVCWRYELRKGKHTKVPCDPHTGGRADTTDRATWGTFAQATRRYTQGGYDGLGFVFAGEFVGIDLDDCRDPETGEIAAWAHPILAPFAGCYMETSPSGTGVHIIVLGAMPDGGNRTPYGGGVVEMYGAARFFTITGAILPEAAPSIEQRQDAIDALHAALFPKAEKRRGPRPAPRPVSLDDQALLDKAMNPNASAGRDFAALWRGDISAYGSDDSRGDFNLARHLAFWTGGDAPRIERLMRSSGLMREKFDQRDGRYGTYLLRTIEKAVYYNAGRYYSGAKDDFMHCQVDSASDDAPAQETTDATGQNACCAAKDKIIAQLQRELKKARARIEELEAAHRWEKKARSNKELSATTKAVARTAIEHYHRAKPVDGHNHLRKLYYPAIAKDAGVSVRTVSAEIEKLAKIGAGEKDMMRDTSAKTGKRVDRVLWAPTLTLLEKPDAIRPPTPRNHGGKRACPECGSKHLRVKIHAKLTCMECGNKWEEESAERIQRGDEAEMAARSDTMLAEGGFSPCQVDSAKPDADCSRSSVQTESLQGSQPETVATPGMNHRDERAEVLALAESLGWQTRIPVRLENVGGTAVRWRDFTYRADNALIDEALRMLRIRAQAYEMAVS